MKKYFLYFFIALPIVFYFYYIYLFGVNVPHWDDWGTVGLFRHMYLGNLSFNQLWGQENENRLLFPHLVSLLILYVTHYNLKVVMYISAVFLTLSCYLLFLFYKKYVPANLWWFIPVPYIIFGLIDTESILWGVQLGWFMVLFFFLLSIYLLCSSDKNRYYFILSLSAGLIASYSSIQGLIVWPVGFLYLLILQRVGERDLLLSMKYLIIWLGIGFAATILYFKDFNFNSNGNPGGYKSTLYIFHHPIIGLRYFLTSLGSIMPKYHIFFGIIILLYAVAALYILLHKKQYKTRDIIFVSFIIFGLIFDLFITIGRSSFGVFQAHSSRYTIYNLLLFIGIYLFFLQRFKKGYKNFYFIGFLIILFLICIQVPYSLKYGFFHGSITRNHRLKAANVLAAATILPPNNAILVNQMHKYIYPAIHKRIINMINFLKHYKLSIFNGDNISDNLRAIKCLIAGNRSLLLRDKLAIGELLLRYNMKTPIKIAISQNISTASLKPLLQFNRTIDIK